MGATVVPGGHMQSHASAPPWWYPSKSFCTVNTWLPEARNGVGPSRSPLYPDGRCRHAGIETRGCFVHD